MLTQSSLLAESLDMSAEKSSPEYNGQSFVVLKRVHQNTMGKAL